MLDHVCIGVSELGRSRRFYDAALKPLGIVRLNDFENHGSDYGAGVAPLGVEFTITEGKTVRPSAGTHHCFQAADRQSVIDFYDSAVGGGGTCDGEPGIRPTYHPDYFAAFVLDPDGHRIGAVCHAPENSKVVRDDTRNVVTTVKDFYVRIRRAAGIDADIVATLARAFHAEDGHPLSDEGVGALLLMLEPGFRDGMVLLLEVDHVPSGYGVLSFGYGIEHGGPETFLEDIYVVPERRAHGFGGILIKVLEDRARAAGCRAVHLEVMPGNRAEQWYRRLGWNDRGSLLLTKPI